MAFVVADRVKETTTTVGTGAVALAGAVFGFRTFASGIGNSNTTYYTIASQSANEWEVGYGTLDATSANLARTTVFASSNGGSLVTFSAGTKDVFVTQSAARTLVQASGGATANGILYYDGAAIAATTAAGTTGQVLLATTSAAPSWGQVSLTAGVTGVLPVANGGTNRSVGNYSVYDNEIHVGKNGNDTTGDGTLINPVLTITKALTLVGAGRNTVIVHPGGYTENPTVSSTNTTIATSELTGANTIVYGTLTLSAAARVSGLKMTNLTITGLGNTYISNCTVDTQVVKSGTNYVEIINSELQCVSGIQISGSGAVSIVGNKCWAVAVSNASANVLIKDCYQVITPSVSAGTLQIDGSAIFAASPTSNAVTSSAGTAITLANSFILNSAGTSVERVSLAGNYSILNLVYDKTNSTFAGTSLNAIDYFQYINADRVNFNGSTSGITGLIASAVAGTTSLTLPAATDTLVGRATTDTLTNKTLVAPALGTPTSGNLSNCTSIPVNQATGNLPVANLNSGTSASATTFWRGDGTWGTPAGSGGTVTSVGISAPSIFTVTNSPVTGSGTLTLSYSGTALPVANGGTGLTSGTSGGVPYYSATGTIASSAALNVNGVVYGGGAGGAPSSTSAGSTNQVLLGNTSSAPSWGQVPNAALANSSITLGSTSVSLGATASSLAGLASVDSSNITLNGSQVLAASNYNSYAPTLTGTGASGTWGISITGNAATATTATNQSGGTVNATTGTFSQNITVGTGTAVDPSNVSGFAAGQITEGTTGFSAPGIIVGSSAGQHGAIVYGSNTMYFGTENGSDNTMNTRATLSSAGVFNVTGAITQSGSQVLTAGNYNSYAPTLTGTGASGTWSINVTGSAGSAGSATNATNLYGAAGTIQSTTTGTAYSNAYQVREALGGSGNTSSIYTPRLAWHWSGVVASSIGMESSGRIAIFNNPGTSYENLVCNQFQSDRTYGLTDIRSPIFYDYNDTTYYLDPASTSNLATLRTVGDYYINNSSPTIYLQDTDHRSSMVHCNSNIFYILRGSGTNSTSWAQYNGYWPLEISLETNNAVFGGVLEAATDMRAPIFYDRNNTAYYVDPNGTSVLNTVYIAGRATTYAMYYQGFTLDANTMDTNSTGFTYSVNAPATGPIARFSAGGSYDLWLNARYSGGGPTLYFRTRDGDAGTLNSWRTLASYGINYSDSLWATIFYDSDNSGYYVNPNSTSVLYNAVLTAQAGGLVVLNGNPADTINASTWYGIGGSNVLGYGSYSYMVQVAGYYGLRLRSTSTILDIDGPTYGSGWAYVNTNLAVAGQIRAPIFYDTDNTVYYVDPAGTSNINALNFVGQLGWTGSAGSQAFDLASNDGYASMRVIRNNKASSDGMYIGYANTNSGVTRIFGGGQTSGELIKYASYTYEPGSFRAPIFYDNDNTTYYADLASTGTSILAAGNITAYYSDERLKTKLGKIENAVDKVMMLEGFYYEANETAQKLGYKPKREVGVSAQDVQRVLPEIVTQAPISAEYLTIDYERLTPLLIEAIKELKAEIEALKK